MEHIREYSDQGYRIQLDLSRQVLGLDIPEQERWSPQESPLFPTLPRPWPAAGGIASAAALALKAKQFDDGLYAATELAAQNGAGRYPGKVSLLTALVRSLAEAASANTADVLGVLCGACELGGLNVAVPQSATAGVKETVAAFLQDELRSKPIGFYTWTGDLEAIFRQDRMLQTEVRSKAGIEALIHVLRTNEWLRDVYVSYLNLIARLTNPFAKPDLRPLLADADPDRKQAPPEESFFFPPSRAHETDLIMKLYGDQPIPEGFNLMNELIARIRSGDLQLRPTEQSGWYDYQIWSIEPLAIPDKMPEAKRLRLDERYREHLLELFKGIYALTRETHAKQLLMPCPAAALSPVKKIYIQPELSAEPLATSYLRRALSYRFIRHVLAEIFGADALRRLRRLTPKGLSSLDLAEELDGLETLFYGAHVTVSHQLGLTADATAELGSGKGPGADAERFANWAKNLEKDEDLGQDARMMVPVFYDLQRRKTKVWLLLGWTRKRLRIYFATPPPVVDGAGSGAASAVAGLFGRRFGRQAQPEQDQPKVVFGEAYKDLACPVTAEVYVERILHRDEFRRHCDTYKTQFAILENLSK
jgi:hypothetical protein